MTAHKDEHERELAFAEIALGQIRALKQSAQPRNYEIWYAYATGYYPSLNRDINEMLDEERHHHGEDLERFLRDFYFAATG